MKTPPPMTKPPRAVAREALALAREALPAYCSTTSRKDFTAHPRFAVLALKTFLKTDHRGGARLLADFAEIRDDLGLAKAPHYPTLCYAAARLLKRGGRRPPRPRHHVRGRSRPERRPADRRRRRGRAGEPAHVPVLLQAVRPEALLPPPDQADRRG